MNVKIDGKKYSQFYPVLTAGTPLCGLFSPISPWSAVTVNILHLGHHNVVYLVPISPGSTVTVCYCLSFETPLCGVFSPISPGSTVTANILHLGSYCVVYLVPILPGSSVTVCYCLELGTHLAPSHMGLL